MKLILLAWILLTYIASKEIVLSDRKAIVMIHQRMITTKIKGGGLGIRDGKKRFKKWDSSGYESIKKEELF